VITTVVVTVVLGTLFTWPFGLMVGGVMLVLTLAVAWGITHPPDPFAQPG
jgi:ABC-type transport system involved in cytochrome bd biosynthesis fused ATPase/permease subunit